MSSTRWPTSSKWSCSGTLLSSLMWIKISEKGLDCQLCKITMHTKVLIGTFSNPKALFSNIHSDIVNFLPSGKGFYIPIEYSRSIYTMTRRLLFTQEHFNRSSFSYYAVQMDITIWHAENNYDWPKHTVPVLTLLRIHLFTQWTTYQNDSISPMLQWYCWEISLTTESIINLPTHQEKIDRQFTWLEVNHL